MDIFSEVILLSTYWENNNIGLVFSVSYFFLYLFIYPRNNILKCKINHPYLKTIQIKGKVIFYNIVS